MEKKEAFGVELRKVYSIWWNLSIEQSAEKLTSCQWIKKRKVFFIMSSFYVFLIQIACRIVATEWLHEAWLNISPHLRSQRRWHVEPIGSCGDCGWRNSAVAARGSRLKCRSAGINAPQITHRSLIDHSYDIWDHSYDYSSKQIRIRCHCCSCTW